MLTVILAGGKSSRMGRDKVTLDFLGKPLLERLTEKYSVLPWETALSVDREGRFESPLRQLPDIYPGQGPLAGIHAAFTLTDEDGIFLTAADIPFGSPELALRLAELIGDYDVCCVRSERGLEPLFGVYRRSCLEAVTECLMEGRRSVKNLFEKIRLRTVTAEELPEFDFGKILLNMNRPEDYAEAVREAERAMYREKIDKFFEENAEAMFADMAALVSIKSVRGDPTDGKPFGDGPAKALAAALNRAEAMGFKTRNFENYAGTVEMNNAEPVLGILAHLDVVPEGDGWLHEPYKPVIENGVMYGRGTSDDKGPAVAALYALLAARTIAPELTKGARLVLGCAEETGSECMEYYFKHEKAPQYVFSPDASYPVINIEKGHFHPKFGMKWDESCVLPRVISVKGGVTANIVPGKSEAVVEGMDEAAVAAACEAAAAATGIAFQYETAGNITKIYAEGVTAHASTPEGGNNAQSGIIDLLCRLPLADDGATRALKALHELFPHGDIHGDALGIHHVDDISGELTLNFSILDMDTQGFTAQFDSRVPICANKENTAAPVIARLAEYGIETTSGRRMLPPHHVPEESEFVQTLLDAYVGYTGNPRECLAMGGGTYVHDIEGGVAFGCGMPGREYNIHGAEEFADLDELLLSAKIFTEVIINMCK